MDSAARSKELSSKDLLSLKKKPEKALIDRYQSQFTFPMIALEELSPNDLSKNQGGWGVFANTVTSKQLSIALEANHSNSKENFYSLFMDNYMIQNKKTGEASNCQFKPKKKIQKITADMWAEGKEIHSANNKVKKTPKKIVSFNKWEKVDTEDSSENEDDLELKRKNFLKSLHNLMSISVKKKQRHKEKFMLLKSVGRRINRRETFSESLIPKQLTLEDQGIYLSKPHDKVFIFRTLSNKILYNLVTNLLVEKLQTCTQLVPPAGLKIHNMFVAKKDTIRGSPPPKIQSFGIGSTLKSKEKEDTSNDCLASPRKPKCFLKSTNPVYQNKLTRRRSAEDLLSGGEITKMNRLANNMLTNKEILVDYYCKKVEKASEELKEARESKESLNHSPKNISRKIVGFRSKMPTILSINCEKPEGGEDEDSDILTSVPWFLDPNPVSLNDSLNGLRVVAHRMCKFKEPIFYRKTNPTSGVSPGNSYCKSLEDTSRMSPSDDNRMAFQSKEKLSSKTANQKTTLEEIEE